ncbi:MAG: purine-binding chemotaxis protein CheW [Desulfobacteraceae bacterium]|nr:MAG: purine-binding chemotaxis protein CheW [Desulfobacteraceae bacterium]
MIDQENIVQLVGFRLGPKLFGASILNVREIIRNPRVETVDGLPDFVEGVVRIRGEVLPIVNLGRILGVKLSRIEEEKLWVLVAQSGKRNIGYIVDSVTPIIRISNRKILSAPDLILSSLRNKYIKGVCETDKGLIVIVDLEHMMLDDEIKEMERLAVE